MEKDYFNTRIIGHPNRKITLGLIGPVEDLQPRRMQLGGISDLVDGFAGERFWDVYENGQRSVISVDQIADDFNPFNPFQFVKLITFGYISYREFVSRARVQRSFLWKVVIQSFIPGPDPIFLSKLFIGSENPNNKDGWGFPYLYMTRPKLQYDSSSTTIEINKEISNDLVLAIEVPAGAFFDLTFYFDNSKKIIKS